MSPRPPSSFVTLAARYDRMLAAVEAAILDGARLGPADRVLDVGCGAGGTTLAAARRVGPRGHVTGIDLDPDAIAVATARAQGEGSLPVDFVVGDAQVWSPEPRSLDAVVSRMGSLHFSEPVVAYRNLARALRPGGRLSFCAAREPARNPWATVPRRVLARELPAARGPAAEGGQGPFVLSDADRIASLLQDSGFVEVELQSNDEPVWVGDDPDDAWSFFAQADGRRVLAGLDEVARSRLRNALRDALATFQTPRGVWMPASWWVVTARPAEPRPRAA